MGWPPCSALHPLDSYHCFCRVSKGGKCIYLIHDGVDLAWGSACHDGALKQGVATFLGSEIDGREAT